MARLLPAAALDSAAIGRRLLALVAGQLEAASR